MAALDNLTPFGGDGNFAYGLDDRQMVVLCVAGRFRLPPAGTSHHGPLQILDEQRPPPMADEYWSSPATSSLRYASQGVVCRPSTDVYLQGAAWTPRGRSATRAQTSVRVGPCHKAIDVFGNRRWVRAIVGLRATAPEPFITLPLRYESAFGGTVRTQDDIVVAQEPRNPIGCGVYWRRQNAIDQALPNLEAPQQHITSWDQTVVPSSYGPIPAGWQPRLGMAGTYDERWVEERVPLWPRDLDPRFFCAATPALIAPTWLQGGEPVILEGFSPDGEICFFLPKCRVLAKSIYLHTTSRSLMRLAGILIETEESAVTLFWHHAVPLGHGPSMHLHSIVRLLEPWEEQPA